MAGMLRMRGSTYEVHANSTTAERRPSRLFHRDMSAPQERVLGHDVSTHQLMFNWKLPWLSVVAEPMASITEPLNVPTT